MLFVLLYVVRDRICCSGGSSHDAIECKQNRVNRYWSYRLTKGARGWAYSLTIITRGWLWAKAKEHQIDINSKRWINEADHRRYDKNSCWRDLKYENITC